MNNKTYSWKLLIKATGEVLCVYEFTGRYNRVKAIRKDTMAVNSMCKGQATTLSRVRTVSTIKA